MGKATGKTFEEWNRATGTSWSFMNQDRIRVLRRQDTEDGRPGTYAEYTTKKGRVVPFVIPDDVHDFDNPTGQDDFRRYALGIGHFLAQGGRIEDVSDPFHDED